MKPNCSIDQIEEKIEQAISSHKMEIRGGVLLALSGGADSCALLYYLHKRAETEGFYLSAAHLNHKIRGEEADRDQRFCEEICTELSIPLYCRVVDIPALSAKTGRGIEEVARSERYRFFDDILAENKNLVCVATAHTASDNAETVLFNLVRGSGTRGLSGIPPVRDRKIIRPLINLTREEILFYCRANNIRFINDSTNLDTHYTRNYIRSEIIPRLTRINPYPERAIARTCAAARQDNEFIEEYAADFMQKHGIQTEAAIESLAALHPAPLTRVLVKMHEKACQSLSSGGWADANSPPSLEQKHITALLDLLKLAPDSCGMRRISLPGGIFALCERGLFFFAPDERFFEKDQFQPFYLEFGRNDLGSSGAALYLIRQDHPEIKKEIENIYKLFIHIILNFDRINGKLFVRRRKNGDSYRFGGRTRKLKKLFNDAKIPLAKRDNLPVLCDESGIVWVPGFGVRDDCTIQDGCEQLHIYYVC
ncbi:MAG: tRNA lysidine(34) synthetase TilS [Clostridiales bacterium]|nr:tRNA lysidine(34) synthetase TilS [Clostridiales bacterium]